MSYTKYWYIGISLVQQQFKKTKKVEEDKVWITKQAQYDTFNY